MYLPPTFLVPQTIGGIIFGVGFVVCGLCPGTSCVAAAGGRADGAATMLGLLIGVLLSGFAIPWIKSFFESTSYGGFTLPQLFHVPYGLVVAVIVVASLALFGLVSRLERQ
jgi:uncharacterized membrane protein YedE/YeeE